MNNNEQHTTPLPLWEGRGEGPLLSSTYFGPVQWYTKLLAASAYAESSLPMGEGWGRAFIEAYESFPKQTYRNRCIIATADGPLALSIPAGGSSSHHQLMKDVQISDHGNWRYLHWQTIQQAYSESAFFEYYQDDIRPFFVDEGPSSPVRMKYLLDYNMATADTMCRLLDIPVEFKLTEEYIYNNRCDYRNIIRPKNAPEDDMFVAKPYYQVYQDRQGFLPNLSILDLLFNMGPESILVLMSSLSQGAKV